jgi:hypothetical protein
VVTFVWATGIDRFSTRAMGEILSGFGCAARAPVWRSAVALNMHRSNILGIYMERVGRAFCPAVRVR